MVNIADGASYAPSARVEPVVAPGEFRFAAAFLDHGHIFGQCNGLCDAGGTLAKVYDPDPARVAAFREKFPDTAVANDFDEILRDPTIQLVASAAIPNQRAAIGAQVLTAGKDYFTDKSPFTSLSQLQEIEQLVATTGQRYLVYYAERVHNDAAWRAGEMLADGAVGRVLQVINLAPHRLSRDTRPDWFFEKSCYGGILTDIGSHQVEQFLTYAGCRDAEVAFARVCNFNNLERPQLEDFGEMALIGDNGASFYCRVDWFTPDGLRTWGDGRSFILGTQGSLEVRKYIDVARQAPASRLFWVNSEGEQEIDCHQGSGFPFFGQLIKDVLGRTELAQSQRHAFKAAELSMLAQQLADRNR